MDLTILTCNYNTPTLVINLIKSLKLVCEELPDILVVNTSTEEESNNILEKYNIRHLNLPGGTHGNGVNLGLSNIATRNVLLVDTDILFLQDLKKPFAKFKERGLTLMGKVVGDCGNKKLYPRIEPWYCFMDLHTLKQYNIQFFDPIRSKKIDPNERVYDIGSTMFEDVIKSELLIGDVDLENKYFKHYGGMSWREQKYNPNDVDTDIDFGGTHPHKGIYDLALRVKTQYLKDVEYLKNITI